MATRIVAPTTAWQARRASLATIVRAMPQRLPQVMADRAHLSHVPPSLHVRTNTGTMRLLTPRDVAQLREIFVSCQYAEIGFVPRSGWTVLDIGSNLGFFTAWCLSFMRHGAILSVEAVPATFDAQEANIGEAAEIVTRRHRVRVLRRCAVVSDSEESVAFVVSEYSGVSHASSFGAELQASRLDAIIAPTLGANAEIDLMKIDIEGMEARCFRGASLTLARTARVVFEYHGPRKLADRAALLSAAGLSEAARHVNWHGAHMGISFWRRRPG